MVTCCLVGSILTFYLIPKCKSMFLKANISGRDMGKKNTGNNPDGNNPKKIPEAQGVITGCVFLMITYSMIPLWYLNSKTKEPFPHAEFYQLLAALSSITFMLCLGFVDDVLDLRWRHKLVLPTIGKKHALKKYGQFVLNTSCFWGSCAISRNFCFKNNESINLLLLLKQKFR